MLILELRLQVSLVLLPILGMVLLLGLRRRRSLSGKMGGRTQRELSKESRWKKTYTK